MRRRSLAGALAAVALTVGALSSQAAQSAPRQDARQQREEVRAQQAAVAAQIDTSRASLAEIDDALQVLEENLATQEAALERARAEVAQAKQDIADAEAAIEALEGKVGILQDEMRERAVRAYVSPPDDDVMSVLESEDFTSASARRFYVELRAATDSDVADQLEGALADLDHQREVATEAKARAEEKEAEEAERTDAVRQARDDKQSVADSIEATINDRLAESVALAAQDRELSKQIAEDQAALVARLVRAKADADAKAKADAEAAARQQQAAAQVETNQAPSGGETGPAAPPSSPPPSGPAGTGTGGISLCTVQGITVNCIISGQVDAMLSAARNSGTPLSGSGYRDPSRQIELRRQHCGSSYYAIYQASASSCSPPTARPGTSQHEVGLAIDFSNCGRSSGCFAWLRANAANFGFYNLPSESWHWSTSGS